MRITSQTYVSCARTLLALSTALVLLINPIEYLLNFKGSGGFEAVCGSAWGSFSFFCWLPQHLTLAKNIAGVLLLIVATGYRPQIMGPVHWWLTTSVVFCAENINGGEQLAAVLSFLLVPYCLVDNRRWHWQRMETHPPQRYANLVQYVVLRLIQLQIAIVYFEAFAGKILVEEWRDGSVIYYWFTHPVFGSWGPLGKLLVSLSLNGTTALLMTWGALALEFFLAASILIKDVWRKPLFIAGICFHTLIALAHGIPSFAMVMYAALIFLLRVQPEWKAVSVPFFQRKIIREGGCFRLFDQGHLFSQHPAAPKPRSLESKSHAHQFF